MRCKKICSILLLLSLLVSFCACESKPEGNGNKPAHVFVVKEKEIAIHAPADAVLAALGEPLRTEKTGSCAYGGPDRVYEYAGMQIQTYSDSEEGEQYFSVVSLKDDSHATPEGIRIGDHVEKVLAAYGETPDKSDHSVSYKHAESRTLLQFLLRDGKVTNIQYLVYEPEQK